MKKPSIQVIIPTLNEEKGIGPTIGELNNYLDSPKVLVVDGKSIDQTVEIAKNLGANVLFQDGSGKGDAISKAVKFGNLSADYVVIIDADYTYPAEHIPKMIQILEKDPQVGMVCGNRFDGYQDTAGRQSKYYYGNRLIAYIHNFLNGIQLQDPLTGLRVLRAEILREWKVKSSGFDVEVELNHHVARCDYTIVEVPIQYRIRLGEKKLKARHGFTILKRILLETVF